MTTTAKKHELAPAILDEKQMKGIWELKYNVTNSQKNNGFGGRLLTSYIHPLTKRKTPLMNADKQELIGFMIDRPTMVFKPDENQDHRDQLDWLLGHPEVGVEDFELPDNLKKNKNAKILLKNLDHQYMTAIDEENVVDKVVGRLAVEGVNGMSLKRLRFLLAYFNMPYRDLRNITNPEVEKKLLVAKAKNLARTRNAEGKFMAVEMDTVISAIDNYEMYYEVKEMSRTGIVITAGGMMKYNNYPIGSSFEKAIDFFRENPDQFISAQGELTKRWKAEGLKQ